MAVENISIRIKDNIKDIEKELDSLDRRIAKLKGQRAIEWNTTKLKSKRRNKNINVDIKIASTESNH